MPTSRVLVILATYNERETLPPVVDEIHAALPQADLLVVDDNSPDGTGQWCDEFAGRHSWFTCMHRSGKLGLGSATFTAFRHAIQHCYDIAIVLDADGSHPPEFLPGLLARASEVDVAIGSRYCTGGRIIGWPWRRHVASRLVNFAARHLLRLSTRDCSGSFRAYRVEQLRKLDFDEMVTGGYAYLEEILWRLKRAGATFAEVPIEFRERRAGQSKINAGEVLEAIRVLSLLGFRERFRS